MTQRIALLIAAGLTAFFLVALGGLSMTLMQPQAAPAVSTSPPPAPAVADSAGVDATGPALSAEQEAIYQQALQEARARLDEANRRLAAANEQLRLGQAPPSPPPVPPAPEPTAPPSAPALAVSPDRAALIAATVAPGATPNKAPELVTYQDQPAYEVSFARGLVYVDATSGRILYNGLAPAIPAPVPATGAGTRQDNNEHENDGDD